MIMASTSLLVTAADTGRSQVARTLPRSLAPIVEDLELDQPELVTMRTCAT